MPVGLGIMQTGRISVYDTTTTFSTLNPAAGAAYCSNSVGAIVNVQNNTAPFATTTMVSNGPSLPQGTINVSSTTGFPPAGQIFISIINTIVSYTGTTPTSFTGCTGGSGNLSNTQTVTSPPFAPQGAVSLQDTLTNTVLQTGTLAAIDHSNSQVSLSPVSLPIGIYNLSLFYTGQDGGSHDIFHQFKPSQSAPVSYLVKQAPTTTSISGPSSFAHNTSPGYFVSIFPISGSQPSVGKIVFTGKLGTGPVITLGNATPSGISTLFLIPANTFAAGSLLLTATYSDSTDGCYGSSVGTTTVTVT